MLNLTESKAIHKYDLQEIINLVAKFRLLAGCFYYVRCRKRAD